MGEAVELVYVDIPNAFRVRSGGALSVLQVINKKLEVLDGGKGNMDGRVFLPDRRHHLVDGIVFEAYKSLRAV
jgi:hypothetical protein